MDKKKKRISVPKDMCFPGTLSRSEHFYGRTKEEVEKKADAYFDEYHPMGYGTIFDQPIHEHPKGYWFCAISRYNSCD